MASSSPPASGRARLALAVLALLCFLPGLTSLPPIDRDEPRYAQATRQMLETGDFVRIRFLDTARHKKPAGIHWLQAASAAAFGGPDYGRIGAYRVPSALGALAAVLLAFETGRRLLGVRTAALGGALLAADLVLLVEARLATTDAVLLATIAAAMLALARCHAAAREGRDPPGAGNAALFWLALGGSILVKGPVGPLAVGGAAVALAVADRDRAWLRPLRPAWGVPALGLVVLPWAVAVTVATGGRFFADAIGGDLVPKLVSGQESHGAPPLAYLVTAPLTLWPAALLLPAGLVAAWRRRGEPAVRFLLAWAVPYWVVIELVPTKLPTYVLPAAPPLALLAAAWAVGGRRRRAVAATGIAVSVAMSLVGLGVVIPRIGSIRVADRVAAALAAHGREPGEPVAIAGFTEPSLVFRLGSRTIRTDPAGAAAALASGAARFAVVADRESAALHARPFARVDGISLAKGHRVRLGLYAAPRVNPRARRPLEAPR